MTGKEMNLNVQIPGMKKELGNKGGAWEQINLNA